MCSSVKVHDGNREVGLTPETPSSWGGVVKILIYTWVPEI